MSTDGRVTCMYEEPFTSISKIAFNAELDHARKKYRFGVGFSLQFA